MNRPFKLDLTEDLVNRHSSLFSILEGKLDEEGVDTLNNILEVERELLAREGI